jgi:hypothetical protein
MQYKRFAGSTVADLGEKLICLIISFFVDSRFVILNFITWISNAKLQVVEAWMGYRSSLERQSNQFECSFSGCMVRAKRLKKSTLQLSLPKPNKRQERIL